MPNSARVAIRNVRRDGMDQIKKAKAAGMAEDDQKMWADEVQELTDKAIAAVDKRWKSSSRDHAGLIRRGSGRPEGRIGRERRQDKGQGTGPAEHVAIIMDGNGRWATARGWPRLVGPPPRRRAGARDRARAPDWGSAG
jgi:hypothetical protein